MKFGKYYVEVFDVSYTQYGGHWQWFGRFFNVWNFSIVLQKEFKFSVVKIYYDGWNLALWCGWISFGWMADHYPKWMKKYGDEDHYS